MIAIPPRVRRLDALTLDQVLEQLPGVDRAATRAWVRRCVPSLTDRRDEPRYSWRDVLRALLVVHAWLPGGPLDGPWRVGRPVGTAEQIMGRWSAVRRWHPQEPLGTWVPVTDAARIRGTSARTCLRQLAWCRGPAPLDVLTSPQGPWVRLYDIVMADRSERCFGRLVVPPNYWAHQKKWPWDGASPDRHWRRGQASAQIDVDWLSMRLLRRLRLERAWINGMVWA